MTSQISSKSTMNMEHLAPPLRPPVLKRQLPVSGAKWFCLKCNNGLSNYCCSCDKCGYNPLTNIRDNYEKKQKLERQVEKMVRDIISKI